MLESAYSFGLLTLGQSPRTDVEPTFRQILGEGVQIRQAGALDGKSFSEICELSPQKDEPAIETRLSDGSPIMLSRPKLMPLLLSQAEQLNSNCRYVVMLCSGEFPALRHPDICLVEPVLLLRAMMSTLARGKNLGIIGPESDMADAPAQWQPYANKIVTAPASPYEKTDIIIQAAVLNEKQGADILLLDDMGFSKDHADAARAAVKIPVICATSATARLLGELI